MLSAVPGGETFNFEENHSDAEGTKKCDGLKIDCKSRFVIRLPRHGLNLERPS